ncbi:MAG TPA: hypothetical protein VFS43_35680 [Polyangiaceae bacterium]|nr:hypothetical protein [Polyangiaceae bacterium]
MSAARPSERSAARRARGAALRWALLPLVSATFGALPRPSRADSGTADALALFNEGVRLRQEGKLDEACAMFAESHRREPTAGKLLNVASCHERGGKLATAWAEFLSAALLFKARGDEVGVAECHRRASLLEPFLPRLTVRVERHVPGLAIKLDGRAVAAAQLGSPLPVDPGEHTLVAEAPGHVSFRVSPRVGPGGGPTVIDLPALAERRPAVAAAGRPMLGYVVGGLGLVALGTGAVFGAMAFSSNQKAENACPSADECAPDVASDHRDRASTRAWVANVGVGVGLLGLAAGGYLFLTTPSQGAGAGAKAHQGVTIAVRPAGLQAIVRF